MALSDYQLIEYIQGVEGAYINSGYQPTRNTQFDVVAEFPDITATGYVWGVYGGSYYYSFSNSTSSKYYWRHRSSTGTDITPQFASGTKLHITQTVNSSTGVDLVVEDVSTGNTVSAHRSYPSAGNAGKNMYICGMNQNGTLKYTGNIKIYSFIAKDSAGTEVRNFVPVREKVASGSYIKVGLYDTITGAIFWSGGSGSSHNFIAGPDIVDNAVHINVGGTWKTGVPYVNVNGTWKAGKIYINVNGTWKEGK